MIRALPQQVVDRIAAGEVVERPASVVKELIENALDAGARRIDVSIAGGGLELVRVADDGAGLGAEDLPLAFAAHATSKLTDVDDLAHIASFGFRGEALASIGAVARCRITSASGEDGAGLSVTCEGGEVSAPAPLAAPRGTVVEVRDLFFNTPARRAFLGAVRTETARCRELVNALSLVHDEVRFALEVDGKSRLKGRPAGDLNARLAAVYDAEFAASMVPVSGHEQGLRLSGRLSLPAAARPRPRAQLLFVNGRLIRDRRVATAVRVACKDFLPGSLQPSWVLALSVDPACVDVNVHPTKAEVRFRDKELLFGLVRRACRAALLSADLTPHAQLASLAPPHTSGGPPRPSLPVIGQPDSAPGTPSQDPISGGRSPLLHGARGLPSSDSSSIPDADAGVSEPTPSVSPGLPSHTTATQPTLLSARAAVRFLQVLDTYLVHDGPEGLVIVDQHALHERILYARLAQARDAGQIERQRLLLPQTVRLDPLDLAAATERADEFKRIGLELAPFGHDLVAISAVPAVLRNEDPGALLMDLLHPRDLHGGIPDDLDRRLFTIACHAAVRSGDPLSEEDAAELLRQGSELEHDATCPHGRPTRLVVGKAEFERLFKRSGF
ncbi:MAG: DNA mismatch repair endonuclease MutL [Planctomycetota bacterium]|nr:MAG: DNA mismatch repair endonuclease MutL [Planctomycetota bacterium]